MIRPIFYLLILISLILSAAIFGFFYAWVCSTMWGLDQTDPRVAIQAMQSMNASVRNAVFFPAFFLTPVASALVAIFLFSQGLRLPAYLFGASGLVYLTLGMILTMVVNVPMNETLAQITPPEKLEDAKDIWDAYSARWQFWNITRTITSGIAFTLAAWGALSLPVLK